MATVPVKGSDNQTYEVEVQDDSPDGLIQVVAVDNFPATQPVSGTVAVSNLPVTQPVSGTVAVSNFPGTQPVSVASLPLPSGAATDAGLAAILLALGDLSTEAKLEAVRALLAGTLTVDASGTAVPVTDNGGSLTVDGTVTATGPLTDTQLRATPVPVSAAALPLPSGAATETTLAAIKTGTDKIIAAPATAAGQATEHTDLVALLTQIALAASSSIIGNVGGISALITSTPTLSVAGSYSSGDYIGPSSTPASFANVVRSSGGTALLKSLTIVDKVTTAAVAMELWLFSATFSAPTDNGSWTITDAEALTCLAVIPISAGRWYASGANKVYTDDTLGIVLQPAATSIFYALVPRATSPTWANGDLQLSIGVLKD